MAFENLCMYCFEDNGGADVCPHCGRDARAAVPQIQLLPGTLVYNERFLVGRALGQDASGIVYAALDTRRNVKIRIREYLPRDCARRLNSGEVVPEAGSEDEFEAGMRKLRASVEGVEDPSKRHFFFEENGTGYIAQRKASGAGAVGGDDDEGSRRGGRMALVVIIAAVLVIGVAVGVIALVNYFTSSTDTRTEAPITTGADVWQPPESPTPTPYAQATFAAISDPTHSWMDFTNPDLSGNASDFTRPTPVPTPEGGFDGTINSKSSPELITRLQQLLAQLGWLDAANVNGVYDEATIQAVKNFQQYMNDTYAIDEKLTVDGIAGRKTLTWLLQTDISARPTPTPAPITPSPTQAGKVIDENSSAEEIKYVQLQLAQLGILRASDVTGVYDSATRQGILNFQMRVNDLQGYDALAEDGVCGDRTLAYLDYYVQWWLENQPTAAPTQNNATPTPVPEATPDMTDVIDENSGANAIRRVQEMLIILGYLEGPADGVYGDATYAAVRAAQQDLHDNVDSNVQVTGRCDVLTREYLERYSVQAQQQTAAPTAQAPSITVSGAQRYEGGVYYVGAEGVKISWMCEGAQGYNVELTAQDGSLVNREDNTPYTSLTLTADSLSATEPYRFTVTALDAGASSYVTLMAADASATDDPSSAAGAPAITVTGSLSYSEGVYRIGQDGAVITWTAQGASAYSLYVMNEAGGVIFSNKNVALTEYRLEANAMNPGETYTFSVVAVPEGGTEEQGQYSAVRIMLDAPAATDPAATPSTNLEAPVITVSEALGEMDGVYYIGETTAAISWSAAGDVSAYSVYLINSLGETMTSLPQTSTQSMSVAPATMTAGEVYTLRVIAIPVGGDEASGLSAQVQLALYTGQTPPPSEIGHVSLTVSGHSAFENGVYYAGGDAMVISWFADGDVAGYDVLVTAANGDTVIDSPGVDETSMTVDPADLIQDVAYTIIITAVPNGGTAEDGNSATAVIMRAAPPAVGDVQIGVSGYASQNGGAYVFGDTPVELTWESANAVAYSIYLSSADGEVVNKRENITDTEVTLSTDGLNAGETYTFTVIAIGESGNSEDNANASVQLAVPEEQIPVVTAPVITVSGHTAEENGVYTMGEAPLYVEWSSENAASYSIYLGRADGSVVGSFENVTETNVTITADQLNSGQTYTLTVIAIGESGKTEDKASASVQIHVSEAAKPVLGNVEITVDGYVDFADGIYYADESGLTIGWSAENAATYNVALHSESGDVINSVNGVTQDTLKLDTSASEMPSGVIYVLSVTPIDANGQSGEAAQIQISRIAPQPVAPGLPSITVEGHADQQNGVYIVGDSDVTVKWSAENAAVYSVYVYNGSGGLITSKEKEDTVSITVKPSSMPEGETVTITVIGVSADGTEGESASVQLTLAEDEPIVVGKPEIRVSGDQEYDDGVYYVGESITFEWSAENAQSYNAYVINGSGNVLRPFEEVASVTLMASDIPEGEVLILRVTGVGADGTPGESAELKFALREEESGPVTPDSSSERIREVQVRLYNLGWISADNAGNVEQGVLDDITIQAVADFQNHVIAQGLNPDIGVIDPINPAISEETLSMLFDTNNPINRPAE